MREPAPPGVPMFSKVGLVVLWSTALVAAQGRGGGGGGGDQSGGESMTARALTPFEQFAGKLKIDLKTQAAAVEKMFADGAKEAGAVGQEILQLRQRLVNAELTAQP